MIHDPVYTSPKEYYKVTDKTVDGFFEEHRYLSNFHICSNHFRYMGRSWITSEHAYMWGKLPLEYAYSPKFGDALYREVFAMTPAQVKRWGQTCPLRDDWGRVKVSVMENIVREKFFRNPDISEKLIETGTRELREVNHWGDDFWGVDINSFYSQLYDARAENPDHKGPPIQGRNARGRGENHLGNALMKARKALLFTEKLKILEE